MIWVTTHELTHLLLHAQRSHRRDREHQCQWHAHKAWEAFRKEKAELLAEWNRSASEQEVDSSPVLSDLVLSRMAKTEESLLRWEKKLCLAKTKVRKYRAKMQYYRRREKMAACKNS